MAKAGLSFGSPLLGAMDLDPLGNPYDPSPDIGVGNLTGKRQVIGTEIDAEYNKGMSQFTLPEVKRPAPTGPNVLFDPQQNKVFVNGSLFDLDDADAAVKSREFLDKPRQAAPAGSWQQVTPDEYGKYIKSITDPTLKRRFAENFDTGMAQLRSLFGAGAVLVGADEYGLGVMERAEEDIRKNRPFAGEFTDIGMGDADLGPVEWFVGVLGTQGPMLLETIAAGAIGFVAGSATAGPGLGSVGGTIAGLTGKAAFKKAVKEAAEQYAIEKGKGKAAAKAFMKTEQGKVLKRASGIAGAVTLGYANNFGIASSDVYSELLESGVDPSDFNAKMTALSAGVPYALLDTIPEFVLGAKIFGNIGRGSKGSRLRRGATGAGVGGTLEGVTEAGQEAIVMGATSAYTGRKYEGDETLARLINSFAAGFAIGAPIGGVANLKKTTEADLLQGTPPEDTDASPAEPGMPEGSTQQELFPEDTDLGTAPTQPVEPTQGELFPDQNLGVGNVDQLELFDQPVIPSRQPGFQMELPFGQQRLMAQPQPVQQEMELVAPVGAQGDLFSQQTTPPMPEPAPVEPAPVQNVVESIQRTAAAQPQLQPNLLQQRMQEAAQRKIEADAEAERQAQLQAENEAIRAEQLRVENQRIERNNRELLNSLEQERAAEEIAAYEAEQQGVTQPNLPPVAAPVQNLPTVPVPVAPPRQLDLFRGQVKIPKPSKAEQKAINKANRLRRKQEREAEKAAEEAARPMTPAEARAAGQGILFTQRGEPSMAALKAAGTTAPATTPELVQTTPDEEALAAQQQEINKLKQQVDELREAQDNVVQEQGPAEVDVGEPAGVGTGTGQPDTQEQTTTRKGRSKERLREAQERKKTSAVEEAEAATREADSQQGTQEDSVQGGTQLDPEKNAEEIAILEVIEEFENDQGKTLDDIDTDANYLMDIAYWAPAPTGTNAAALDEKAARMRAKAFVDKAFTSPADFTDGQLKMLDKRFVKYALTFDSLSSTKPWYEYATRRGLVDKIAKDVKITGKPHEAFMGERQAPMTNAAPAVEENSDTMNAATKAADEKTGRFFLMEDGTAITDPLPKLRVQAIANKALSKLKTKPKLKVFNDQQDLLRTDPALFNRIAERRPNFADAPAAGVSLGDEIVIFSDRIKTEKQAKFVVAHETMGHFGMGAFMDRKTLEKNLENVYLSDSSLRVMVNRRVEMGMERIEAIEEELANRAADLDSSVIKQIWYAVKDALNKLGFDFTDDLARYMLRQSRRNLLQGGSGLVSMQELGRNLQSLQRDNTLVRYSLVEDTADAASRAISSHAFTKSSGNYGGMRAAKKMLTDLKDIENIRDVGVFFGKLAENVQSLDNMATRSDGLQQVFNIFQARANRARRFLSNYEGMTAFSNSAFSFTDENGNKQGGPTEEELLQAGQLLAYGALNKQDAVTDTDIRDVGDLVTMQNGVVGINRDNFEAAVAAGELTREDFTNGLRVTLGDQEQEVFSEDVWTPDFPITDRVWNIYNEQRKAVNQSALDVARSTIEGAVAQRDATINQFKKSYGMSDQDTMVLRRVMEQYVNLYQKDSRQEGGSFQYKSESVEDAKTFLREINRALYVKDKVQDWKQGREDTAKFQGQDFQEIIAGLDSLSDKNYTQGQANRITSAIGNLYLLDVQAANAQFNAKRTIMTSYVPFTRRGNQQIRLAAFDDNGEVVPLGDVWKTVLPYYQAGSRKDAREIVDNLNAEFGDRQFTIEDANGKERAITFRAVTETTRKGSVLGQQFSLDDFVNTLARLDVNINPQERERIVEALTAQTQRARRSLQRAGVRGWDQDVVRSTAEYLETQGHIAGQTFYRHRLNNIMLDDSLWRGDSKLLKDLYAETQRTDLAPEDMRRAQNNYDRYAYMYQYMAADGMPQAINRVTGKSMKNLGRGEDYRGTALGLQQWYADASNINDSTEDLLSGETGSRLKMWTVVAQLGGSVATAGINLVSMMTHSIPFLGTYNEARGFGGGFGLSNSALEMQLAARNMLDSNLADATYINRVVSDQSLLDKHGLKRDEALFLANATSEGVLQAAQANALVGTARGGINSNKLQGAVKLWMGMFSYTEQLNRRATALAAFRLHKKRAVAGSPEYIELEVLGDSRNMEQDARFTELENQINSEATEFARTAVNTSQGEYGMFNRPEMARGNVGQYLFIYKQFSIITIQMMKGMSPKGRLYFLGMLFAMSGLKGLPFADDLADLIDTLLQFFGIKKASVEEELIKLFDGLAPGSAKYMMRGGLDQIAAGTFSTRLGFGDLIPLTGALRAGADSSRELQNFFGPVYSGLEGAFVTAGNFSKYAAGVVGLRDQTTSFTGAFRESPVAAMRGIIDAYTYYDTGAVTNSQGKVIDPSSDWGQIAFRAMGFYPSIATRENDIVRLGKYKAEYIKYLRADYTAAYVKAYVEKDRARMREVINMVRDWNVIHRGTAFEFKDFEKRAKRSAKAAAMPTGQRYLKTSPTAIRSDLEELMRIYGLNDEKF